MSAELKSRLKRGSIYSMSPITLKKRKSFTTPQKAATSGGDDAGSTSAERNSTSEGLTPGSSSLVAPETPTTPCAATTPKSAATLANRRRPPNLSTFSSPLIKRLPQQTSTAAPNALDVDNGSSDPQIASEVSKLKQTLSEKEETLRKLNMVKMYRTKVSLAFEFLFSSMQ